MFNSEKEIFDVVIFAITELLILSIVFIAVIVRADRKYKLEIQRAAGAALNSIEKERMQLSRDLHDVILPQLATEIQTLKRLQFLKEDVPDHVIYHLEQISLQLRDVSNDLSPYLIQKGGFTTALENYIKRLQQTENFIIYYSFANINHLLSIKDQLQLYCMLQEIIHNTRRHANADFLRIKITTLHDCILIETFDNGIGFNLKQTLQKNEGNGLRNIYSRAFMLGGTVSFNSFPAKGLSIKICIPVKQ